MRLKLYWVQNIGMVAKSMPGFGNEDGKSREIIEITRLEPLEFHLLEKTPVLAKNFIIPP
jgi:hypothetical protein